MEIKNLRLPSDDSKIYHQILAFLNPLLNLTTQERSILAEIIRLDNEYEALPVEKRTKFIFSREMREDMCDRLNIKKNHFGVVLSNLKQKKFYDKLIIDEYNIIHPYLKIKPDQEGFRLIVDFKLQVQPKIEVPPTVSIPSPESLNDSIVENTLQEVSPPEGESTFTDYEESKFEFSLTPPEND